MLEVPFFDAIHKKDKDRLAPQLQIGKWSVVAGSPVAVGLLLCGIVYLPFSGGLL